MLLPAEKPLLLRISPVIHIVADHCNCRLRACQLKLAGSEKLAIIAFMQVKAYGKDGAGDGDRTRDIQLGKLTFYR